jgi:hypothetical protein
MSRIDRIELDAEDQLHLVFKGLDVDDVANSTEGLGNGLNVLDDTGEVLGSELPDCVVRIGLNQNGQVDLALELLDLAKILVLGASVVVHGSVVDREASLLEDILAFGSIREGIVTNKDAGMVARDEGDCVEEASVL